MKRLILLLTSLLCLAPGPSSVQAALSYWDSNGSTPGAGDTPAGTWDGDWFWSPDPAGASSATSLWSDGDTAVFSAGADATNAFTVGIAAFPQVGGIIFQEGLVTLLNGILYMTNEFEFPIIANTDAIINSALQDVFPYTCGIRKTGPGKLTLGAGGYSSAYSGTNTILEGVVAVTDDAALGNIPAPTIVSNGAALQLAGGGSIYEPLILNGSGVTNSGALRVTTGLPTWGGGAVLGSDVRINMDRDGTWLWTGTSGSSQHISGTNGGNNFNLTFGGSGGGVPGFPGTIRLNIDGRAISLGTGTITKDGLCRLQFETPSLSGAFYFNGGEIFPRQSGGFGAGPVYVAAAPHVALMALPNTSPAMGQAIVLATNANLLFDCRLSSKDGSQLTYTCGGVISGAGGLSVTNTGKAIFTAANTYRGNTTILGNPIAGAGGGTLVLGASASIASSPVIDVQSNATFDVSAVAGGFVLGPAQTLKGNGAVLGRVTASGALSPGASIGNLTFNTNLTLAAGARLSIEVNTSAAPSCDTITVLGTLTNAGAGTVTVTNLGPALVAGDSFNLFNGKPVLNGQALTVASAGGGVVWTNKLSYDGSIAVVSASPPAAPPANLSLAPAGPATFKLAALGAANQAFSVYASTNITAPLANWWLLGTVFSDAGGVIQFVDAQATNKQRFYRFATVPVAPPRVPATNLTLAAAGPASFKLRGLGGANLTYGVYAATNVTTPMVNWRLIGSPNADAGGVIQFLDTQATARQRFYRFGQ